MGHFGGEVQEKIKYTLDNVKRGNGHMTLTMSRLTRKRKGVLGQGVSPPTREDLQTKRRSGH